MKMLFINVQRRVYVIIFKLQQHVVLTSLYITVAAQYDGDNIKLTYINIKLTYNDKQENTSYFNSFDL